MLRRVVRELPPLKWRDEKILQWREQARESRDEVTRLRKELATVRGQLDAQGAKTATPREAAAQPSGPLTGDGATVALDAEGSMPRVELTDAQVKAIQQAGHAPTVGAAPTDPRAYPSFISQLYQARRYRWRLADQQLKNHPRSQIPLKLQNHALAASHGVQAPVIHAIWTQAAQIDLSVLPESFVIKSNGGAGSRGVYPLRRVPGETDLYEVADESRRRITGVEVVTNLTTDKMLTGPWFAEELLVPDVGDSALPSDVKIYAFYGQIGYGFARQAPLHRGSAGWHTRLGFRYFDENGQDIEMRGGESERSRLDIPVSPHLPQMLEAAKVLSAAVPLPFVRVDLYGTTKGIVMGELTLVPGGNQHYVPLQDVRMGRLWEEAEMRLQIDLARNGRPFRNIAGEHPVPENLRPYLPQA
ncbi:ATP-grasp fold amidoligase family protein [Kytococcus sedentarius]|uniref:ATP-grasp fold amidoligase family protein n=1 Tax=Kytococcus sedentarius TaxID=1276 RepID=UPI0035BC8F16